MQLMNELVVYEDMAMMRQAMYKGAGAVTYKLGHKKKRYVSDTRTHCYVNSISRVGLHAGP